MKFKDVLNLYYHICNKGEQGVTVKELIETFNIKKGEIIKFLKLISEFGKDIEFHYYSLNDDIYYDDFEEIDEETVIDIFDTLHLIKNRLDLENTTKLYEILEDFNLSSEDNIINKVGDIQIENFKYINKGKIKDDEKNNILKLKNKIVDYIINKNFINIRCHEKNGIKNYKNINILGIYYDKIKKNYFVVINDNDDIKEINLSHISSEGIEKIKGKKNETFDDFDIGEYIRSQRNDNLVLRVYDEANVIKKLNKLLYEYDYVIEQKQEYALYKIKVKNPMNFKVIINGFGRSVIVEEPLNLKKEIIDDSYKAIENYKKIGEWEF